MKGSNHFQPNFQAINTLQCPIGVVQRTVHPLGWGYMVVQQWVQKWSGMTFCRVFLDCLGYCEPSWPHMNPCKLTKKSEMGKFWD